MARRILAAAAGVAMAAFIGGVAPGQAHAAPITAPQLPATAITSGGLGNWHPYVAYLQLRAVGPGKVALSAPADPASCGRLSPYVRVRFDYVNLATGRAGSGAVQPCRGPVSGPREVILQPGSGLVVGAISFGGQNPPSPALPGVATFAVG